MDSPLHPICVHFATALSVFGIVVDCAGSMRGNAHWQQTGRLSFFAGVIATGLAVLSGWIEQQLPQPENPFKAQMQDVLFYHEYLGYALLGFFIMLVVVRVRIPHRLPALYIIFTGLGLVGLIVQGYLGGELVYRYGAGVDAVQVLSAERKDQQEEKSGDRTATRPDAGSPSR